VKVDKETFWEEENWDAGLIEDRLERALREVYSQSSPAVNTKVDSRYLLIDSKTRKVIVSEPTLLPYRIKEAICRVMFTYFQVPSVTFLSSHVLALASTGLRTGIVVDIGWYDTRILPVLLWRCWLIF
jgi:actin-related protein 10